MCLFSRGSLVFFPGWFLLPDVKISSPPPPDIKYPLTATHQGLFLSWELSIPGSHPVTSCFVYIFPAQTPCSPVHASATILQDAPGEQGRPHCHLDGVCTGRLGELHLQAAMASGVQLRVSRVGVRLRPSQDSPCICGLWNCVGMDVGMLGAAHGQAGDCTGPTVGSRP